MNNDDKLTPEEVKVMLDKELSKKKKKSISTAKRIAAAAVACIVIGGTAVYTLNSERNNKNTADPVKKSNVTTTTSSTGNPTQTVKTVSYMNGASDYKEIYSLFSKAAKKAEKDRKKNRYVYDTLEVAEEAVSDDAAYSDGSANEISGLDTPGGGNEEIFIPGTENTEETKKDDPEHSETYYQEQDVLEADIVKTDGKHIYYLCSTENESFSYSPVLRTADVKDGKFTGSTSIDLNDAIDSANNNGYINAADMYIYNDMIAIICSSSYYGSYYGYDDEDIKRYVPYTFVAFYTTGDEPELIDVYRQDGYYNDVRISPEGYMILTSHFYSCNFDTVNSSADIERYIPYCGFAESYDMISAGDILLPADGFDSTSTLSYTVIGSIDLSNAGAPEEKDVKSLAGYTGSIYCSAENLYTAAAGDEISTTDITRISIIGGNIAPMAGTTINGHIKDQFSMSEYNGYFRVAATYNETKKSFYRYNNNGNLLEELWDVITDDEVNGYYTYENIKTDTRVYVFDMDLNMVGSIGDLGVDEQLRSASFSGDMAYVVTFRQTDPLYAVDLSVPAEPVLLDDLKINGFSTYLQQWDAGHLLGFGQDADENGRITGIKMTMFNNSDPSDLKAEAVFTWNDSPSNYIYDTDEETHTEEWYYSDAVYERKELLIAPEKNLIGVPINYNKYSYYSDSGKQVDSIYRTQYVFFSYENGEFIQKGDISMEFDDYIYNDFDRAVYVGDYVYVLSPNRFVAADIANITVSDELNF
ncbi:beta-propeller domain-containing protein [Ruminococcus sp.]|uniref:beta-propeller domain-containing protein n=1 Tax=Ruminococcus sp. TaxID=41978 RepID=UPI001B79DED7|nr:beta-propeller domain-containing protein [Ruminococcus sp.]MBP5430910.1 beta-propeller domain-containing protein [Ruminococcus sp.]